MQTPAPTHKRSPLQLPDIDVAGNEFTPEPEDDISKASQGDIDAYSVVIATGDATQFLKDIEEPEKPAEEDEGGVAYFMQDL